MKRSPTSPSNFAFTLVELLAAMAILVSLMLLLIKMAGMASDTWLGGQRQANNLTKARAMLDLIALDAQDGLFRNDLAAFPVASGSTMFAFYTKRAGVPAASGTVRQVSLVQYQINAASTNSVLSRGDMAINWSDPATAISFSNTTSFTTTNAGNVVMRDTVPGVVGFNVVFVLADGTTSPGVPTVSGTNPVCALGITIAVVDDKTLNLLSQTNLNTIRSNLASHATGTRSTKADWQDYLNTTFPWGNYPKGLGPGLKIFERYVSIQ